ncbi:Hydroxydechloroatrazine ethylaminohydrolase [Edwardsiella tarda]|nr:Hydroxydechloroatrazine ethylaminohydrolase [Edwardsiella tarda]
MHNKKTLMIKNADLLVTMDDQRREIRSGCMLVEGCRIVAVGGEELLAAGADEELDLRGHVVIPGMVNTHHHMFQTLTRALPGAQDAELFDWLETFYPVWGRLTPEMIYISAQTAMAELMLSGCTTSSDHLYLFPNGCRLDDSIDAAREIGMRFHACRGSMSVGRSRGGLPPDALVESEAAILEDSLRLIESYHDAARFSMLRIALAPCSPFSVSRELMKRSAELARRHGVSLHTHLAENDNDVSYSQRHFGMTPAEYVRDLGWTGPDVWHAHCVKTRPRRDRAIRPNPDRRGPLSLFQHAIGLRYRPDPPDGGCRCPGWHRGGWVGLQRRRFAAGGGAPGDAVTACRQWAAGDECARGVMAGDAWRRADPQP